MTNTTNNPINENATKIYNLLDARIEALHPKKVKAPKKPAVINEAKKSLENKDLIVAIKELYKNKRSITHISEILNEKIGQKFETKIRTVAVGMYTKKNISIPKGNRITKEVKNKKTEFVEIETKDKFTITMLQNILGVKKQTRKAKVVVPKVVNTEDNLDSLLAWTKEEDKGIETQYNWDEISKPKKTRKKKVLSEEERKEEEEKSKAIEDDVKKSNLDKLIHF